MLLACSRRQTIIIDDVVQSKQQLEKLDSSEIFSYCKWLPGEAPPWYDKWNKTILIVVKTKKVERELQTQRHALLNRFLDLVDRGADILIVQDGILLMSDAQKNLRTLTPNQLSSADTMERNAAKELYGSSARPTTLIINMYNSNDNCKP